MGRRRLLAQLTAGGRVALFILFVAWSFWERPLALIRVRWSPNLPQDAREDAERELDLQMVEPTDPDTYRYELWSADRQAIAALVRHRDVADTAGIDREHFRVDPEAAGVALGRAWRGGLAFGGRGGPRRFRLVFGAVAGVTLLLVLAAVATRRERDTP